MHDDATTHLAPGFLVGGGRFALHKQIGEGGMGTVWLAHDERLNEKVALKFLSEKLSNDIAALTNLRQETQKSRKLTHPNIIRIYDLYEAPGELAFISMEYVDGLDLSELKLRQPKCIFPWDSLFPILTQLCDALEYAHGEDVIHRDLKPANMIIDAKGRLKLADFGLAAITYDPYTTARPEGYWAGGTLAYMSPQQLEGHPAGIADDIYALGATLYELLTSKPPFYIGDIAQQARTLAVPPITDRLEEFDLQNEIPRDVRALIMACLSKEPEKRPSSARAVVEWIGATPTAPPKETQDSVPEPMAVATPIEHPQIAPRRTTRTATLVVLSLLLLLALGAVAWYQFAPTNHPARNPSDNSPFRLVDTSFDPGSGANVEVRCLAVEKDGKIVVGGRFTLFNDERHVGFVRLNRDGSVDRKSAVQTDGVVWSLALQPDDKILIAGDFRSVNGEKHTALARLNTDLTVDSTFDCGSTRPYDIRVILPTKDKIFLGGPLMGFHGVRFDRLAELDLKGNALEGTPRLNGNVWALAMQPDGKLVIGGEFTRVSGVRRLHLMRLNPDGERDLDFAPHPNQRVYALALQPDGKILVGGAFDRIVDTQMRCIARVNQDGSIDKTFNPGSGADSTVQSIALQPDGKILIGGTFHNVDGVKHDCLARLNANGTVDQTFAATGISEVVRTIALARDGNILIGGGFTNIDGTERRNIAQLRSKR